MPTPVEIEAAKENLSSLICNASSAVLLIIAILAGALLKSGVLALIVFVLSLIQFVQGTRHASEAKRILRSERLGS